MSENRRGKTVKSDETLFAIAETLRKLDGAGVSAVARELDLAKSTVHAHLRTLETHDYAVKEDGEYRVGLQFLSMGVYAREQRRIYGETTDKLRELADDTQEMASCVVEENGYGWFIDRATGRHAVRTNVSLGVSLPLHCYSAGKAILAHLPDERVEEIIDQRGLTARTPHTVTDREALYDDLAEIREQGFALSLEEAISGVHAVAAPVLDDDGAPLGAINVSGVAHRLTEERCRNELADRVRATANEVELNLTYA